MNTAVLPSTSAVAAPEHLPLRRPELLVSLNLIGGHWLGADKGATFNVRNPADGSSIGSVPAAGSAETLRCVEQAAAVFPTWRSQTGRARAAILRRWHDSILSNLDDLALLISAEQGKPLVEAKWEIAYAASFVEWFAEQAPRINGETIPSSVTGQRILIGKQPVGVVGAITPWNFPAAMVTRKLAPAFAAGCPVVLKPSELTPLTALALALLAEEAGIPQGVLSVVTGDAQAIGSVLTGDRRVRKISFTGSTAVGKLLAQQAAATVKRVSLELGGNAACLVFDDADLDVAIEGIVAAKFRNCGQTCVCPNRIFVQSGIHDAFVAQLSRRVSMLKVGPALAGAFDQGPLINDRALAKVERHVTDALQKGAELQLGGFRHALGGRFYQPTVLTGCTPDMDIAHEETFGPVAPLFEFSSEQDAVRLANQTESGLAAYVFTRDLNRFFRVMESLEVGMLAVNSGSISNAAAPFGGIKESGFGREGSAHGLEEYLELKSALVAGI